MKKFFGDIAEIIITVTLVSTIIFIGRHFGIPFYIRMPVAVIACVLAKVILNIKSK